MTNHQKYILDTDDSCHWYFFPIEREKEFSKWVEVHENNQYDDPIYGTEPEWLQRIDGVKSITFENPTER